MPVGYSSPARNLFLLGSTGAQAVTNFFQSVTSSTGETVIVPTGTRYNFADQNYITTGYQNDSNSVQVGWIDKRSFDPETETSSLTWSNRLEGIPNGLNGNAALQIFYMEQDNDDRLLVVGGVGQGDTVQPFISKYNVDGSFEWSATSKTVTGDGGIRYTQLGYDSYNNYYAVGQTTDSLLNKASFIEKFMNDGTPAWGKHLDFSNGDISIRSVSVNSHDEVLVAGDLDDTNGYKGFFAKLDSNGNFLWDRTLTSDTYAILTIHHPVKVQDIFVDSKDQIYICGYIVTLGGDRGFIAKYTEEGNLIWQRENNLDQIESVRYEKIRADGETETAVVFGTYTDPNSSKEGGILIKYAKNGSVVWRRTLYSSKSSGQNFGSIGDEQHMDLDADPSFYYFAFIDDEVSGLNSTPDRYTFGKVSSSGNGFGAFQYSDGISTIDYEIVNYEDRIGKLSDGSVQQNTSDLTTYPFNANKLLFDDYATQISNKKAQVSLAAAGGLRYNSKFGTPIHRPTDFPLMDLDASNLDNGVWYDATQGDYDFVQYGNPERLSHGTGTDIAGEPGFVDFDGDGDRFEIDPSKFTLAGKTNLTVECWVYVNSLPSLSTSRGYIWDQSPGPAGAALRIQSNSTWTTFAYGTGQSSVILAGYTPETVSIGRWYHLTSVISPSYVQLYIDGKLAASDTGTLTSIKDPSTVPFTIGSSADTTGAVGQISYKIAGQYEFEVPDGVTDVSMVLVGGGGGGAASTSSQNGVAGGGGGGGALMWRNGVSVTSGQILYVTVGAGGTGGSGYGQNNATAGGDTYVRTGSHTGTIVARAGGGPAGLYNSSGTGVSGGTTYYSTYGGGGTTSGGGDGGGGGYGRSGNAGGGGGGAGGYEGNGGRGANAHVETGTAAATGSGGGGGSGATNSYSGTTAVIAGGGGVGIWGKGADGKAPTTSNSSNLTAIQGYAGSGGGAESLIDSTTVQTKEFGGGGAGMEDDGDGAAADGAQGGVRFVWGTGRSYPDTLVGSDDVVTADSREYFDGRIADFRIYDRSLNSTEIENNYNRSKSIYNPDSTFVTSNDRDSSSLAEYTNPSIARSNIVTDSSLKVFFDFSNDATYESRENLLLHSGYISYDSSAGWTDIGRATLETGYDDPFGGKTATKVTKTSGDGLFRIPNFTLVGDGPYVLSAYVKLLSSSGSDNGIRLDISDASFTAQQAVLNEWKRLEYVYQESDVNLGIGNDYIDVEVGSGVEEYLIAGIQLESSNYQTRSSAGRYVRSYAWPIQANGTVKNLAGSNANGIISFNYPYIRYVRSGDLGYFDFPGYGDAPDNQSVGERFIDVDAVGAANDFSGGMTVSVWFNFDAFENYENVLDLNYFTGLANRNIGPRLEADNAGNFRWYYANNIFDGNYNSHDALDSALANNTWYNCAWTFDGASTITTYENGVDTLSTPTAVGSPGTGWYGTINRMVIGGGFNQGSNGARMMNGKIGEVMVYNRALSAAELLQNFNATKAKYGL